VATVTTALLFSYYSAIIQSLPFSFWRLDAYLCIRGGNVHNHQSLLYNAAAQHHCAMDKEEDYIIFRPFNLPLLFQRKKVTIELNGPFSIIRITMSFFPAVLGLIFKHHRMCLKTQSVIGHFPLFNAKCSGNGKRIFSRWFISASFESALFKIYWKKTHT